MTRPNPRLAYLRPALDATGLPWSVEPGKRHDRLMVGGRQVLVMSRGPLRHEPGTMRRNAVAAVKRAGRVG